MHNKRELKIYLKDYGGKLYKRLTATVILMSVCVSQATAVAKEVTVWGAHSINGYVNSDMQTDIELLKEDYDPFRTTGGLVEYFQHNGSTPLKTDLGEAYSWLIDNGILNRDETLLLNNVNLETVPNISLSKSTLVETYSDVNRSDAIMYIYKSVFGPIWGRTIGFETANIRVDNNEYKTLNQIIIDNNGSTALNNGQTLPDGTQIVNDSTNWRYFPQGDEFTSIFGDTNVFITQNDIQQSITQGNDNIALGGDAGSDNSSSQDFDYYADYKSIYYKSGADIWFYRTSDILEMYIQAALSKGLLDDEFSLRTQKFNDTFYHLAEDGASYASWSGETYPLVVNRTLTTQNKVANTEYSNLSEALGVNYTISNNGDSYFIKRNNLYSSDSGYFTTEKFYKMDVYKYIYKFVYAKEKKLSDLEVDMVNYKMGMELDGIANKNEVEILKYLVAKGILRVDDMSEFTDLYSPMKWFTFIEILYRVANPDARYDFSKIQLTDAETEWKEKGFVEQTLSVIPYGQNGVWEAEDVEQEDEPVADASILEHINKTDVGDGYYTVDLFGKKRYQRVLTNSLTTLVADYRYSTSLVGFTFTEAIANKGVLTKWFNNIRDIIDKYDTKNNTYYNHALNYASRTHILSTYNSGDNYKFLSFPKDNNKDPSKYGAVVVPINMILNNLYTVCRIRSDKDIQNKIQSVLEDCFSDSKCKTKKSKNVGKALIKSFKNVYSSQNGLNINNYMKDGKTTKWITNGYNNVLDVLDNLKKVQIYYKNSSNENVTLELNILHAANKSKYDLSFGLNNIDMYAGKIADAEQADLNQKVSLAYTDGDAVAAKTRLSNAVTNAKYFNQGKSTYIDSNGNIVAGEKPATGGGNSDGGSGSSGESDGSSGSGGGSSSSDNKNEIQAFVDPTGKDAFLSWSSIKKYNDSVTDPKLQIPITQVSELLLYNNSTDTYAYFSDGKDMKIALVGTAVVTGDANLGVAFKSGTGESAEYYYHINAIRLLMNAKQELSVMSGVKGFELPEEVFANNVKEVPLMSESGYNEYGVSGIKAQISKGTNTSDATADSIYDKGTVEGNNRYAEFLTLSQANRVMNIVTRRITYKVGEQQCGAYAVVMFEPVDVTELGTKPVTAATTLQDILDSVASPPSSPSGRKVWNKNKITCNAFANWIYGTSGYNYIETGYLLPKAYIYIAPNSSKEIPAGHFEPLTDEQKQMINIVDMKEYTGTVAPLGTKMGETGGDGSPNSVSYYLSKDYRALVHGDRVYFNSAAFKGIEPYENEKSNYGYKLSNASLRPTAFTINGKFKMTDSDVLSSGIPTPDICVIQTKSNGNVVAQVGPIVGTPGKAMNNLTGIINISKEPEAKTTPFQELVNTSNYDSLSIVKKDLLGRYSSVNATSIVPDPYLTLNGARNGAFALYTGKQIKVFTDPNENKYQTIGLKNPSNYKTAYSYSLKLTDAIGSLGAEGVSSDDVESYMQIEFPAYKFTIDENGLLKESQAKVSDFISPTLFTSLNDLIIDEMITASNGAIPVKEIPSGSLLKIGTGYYAASGTSTGNKVFVGYSALDSSTNSAIFEVDEKEASKSFIPQYIRAGNQYVNVSHFFNKFKVLEDVRTNAQNNALKIVADEILSIDGSNKYELTANAKLKPIAGSVESSEGQKYAPVELELSNLLLAYRVSSPDSSVPRYELVSFADENISGALEDLPFWTDNLLQATMFDQTTTFIENNFKMLEIMDEIRRDFEENFGKAFQGDVVTMIRLLLFVILCWLMISSWVCFVFKMGGLSPILEAIYSPQGNNRGNGIDLLKIISCGTITIDTDFNLGKFIQYEILLSILICIVWNSGTLFK